VAITKPGRLDQSFTMEGLAEGTANTRLCVMKDGDPLVVVPPAILKSDFSLFAHLLNCAAPSNIDLIVPPMLTEGGSIIVEAATSSTGGGVLLVSFVAIGILSCMRRRERKNTLKLIAQNEDQENAIKAVLPFGVRDAEEEAPQNPLAQRGITARAKVEESKNIPHSLHGDTTSLLDQEVIEQEVQDLYRALLNDMRGQTRWIRSGEAFSAAVQMCNHLIHLHLIHYKKQSNIAKSVVKLATLADGYITDIDIDETENTGDIVQMLLVALLVFGTIAMTVRSPKDHVGYEIKKRTLDKVDSMADIVSGKANGDPMVMCLLKSIRAVVQNLPTNDTTLQFVKGQLAGIARTILNIKRTVRHVGNFNKAWDAINGVLALLMIFNHAGQAVEKAQSIEFNSDWRPKGLAVIVFNMVAGMKVIPEGAASIDISNARNKAITSLQGIVRKKVELTPLQYLLFWKVGREKKAVERPKAIARDVLCSLAERCTHDPEFKAHLDTDAQSILSRYSKKGLLHTYNTRNVVTASARKVRHVETASDRLSHSTRSTLSSNHSDISPAHLSENGLSSEREFALALVARDRAFAEERRRLEAEESAAAKLSAKAARAPAGAKACSTAMPTSPDVHIVVNPLSPGQADTPLPPTPPLPGAAAVMVTNPVAQVRNTPNFQKQNSARRVRREMHASYKEHSRTRGRGTAHLSRVRDVSDAPEAPAY
jgi:hypothetical protein